MSGNFSSAAISSSYNYGGGAAALHACAAYMQRCRGVWLGADYIRRGLGKIYHIQLALIIAYQFSVILRCPDLAILLHWKKYHGGGDAGGTSDIGNTGESLRS